MGRPKKYGDELRRRAVDEVLERDRKVARSLGIGSAETLRKWVKQGLVDGEAGGGQVGHAEVFGVADVTLSSPSTPVERFEVGDVGVGQVGDEDLEAVTVDVGEGQLRAGVWFLAAGDHPGALRPTCEVDQPGEFSDLAGLAFLRSVGGDRRLPLLIVNGDNHLGDLGFQLVTDDEAHALLAAAVQEAV